MGTGEATVFRSIVVGTDGTPTARQAVTKAQELARLAGARLHLVSAYRAPAQVTTAEAMLVTPVISEAEIRGEVARAGKDAKSIARQPGRGDVGDDPAALVEELGVDGRPDGSVALVGGRALEQREGAGAGHLDLAERRQVDDPDALPDGAVLLPHPVEPLGPVPAPGALDAAISGPRLPRSMQVGALPAGLRAEDGARDLVGLDIHG